MKKNSLEQQQPNDFGSGDLLSSKSPSSQEIDYETQSFTSKPSGEDPFNQKFKAFQNERDSTGKLIQKSENQKTQQQTHFNFLRGQEIILKTNSTRLKHSTTHLLGLNERAITADDRGRGVRHNLKNFKLNLQADQGFIKQFRETQKIIKPSTSMNYAFLATKRDYFYRENKLPGPGVYLTEEQSLNGQGVEFTKSPQLSKLRDIYCEKDYYDFDPLKKNISVPSFERTISREGAYQRSIFAQMEIQKRQNKVEKEVEIDEKKIDKEMEILHQQQQKYGKTLPQQKMLEFSIQVRRFQQPEFLHFQWAKMLDKYGFRKQGGRLYKKQGASIM